jgi:chromate reductase
LLGAAAAALPPGIDLEMYDGLREIPPYDATATASRPIRQWLHCAGRSRTPSSADRDAGSIPGVLKNALDWASRPFPHNAFRGKPVAVIGASTGLFGAVWAQAETRKVLGIVGADVIGPELPVGQAEDAFTADGGLLDLEQQAALTELVEVLAARVGAEEAEAA